VREPLCLAQSVPAKPREPLGQMADVAQIATGLLEELHGIAWHTKAKPEVPLRVTRWERLTGSGEHRVLSQFSFEAICGMLSRHDQRCLMRESDDDDQLQGGPFSPGDHFDLMGVRWYLAYPLSYRHVEELMEERGVLLDHATIQRWVVKYSPQLEEAFHRRKRPVWVSWRMDETYIKVKVRRESTV